VLAPWVTDVIHQQTPEVATVDSCLFCQVRGMVNDLNGGVLNPQNNEMAVIRYLRNVSERNVRTGSAAAGGSGRAMRLRKEAVKTRR
jgi:hypothetical protein